MYEWAVNRTKLGRAIKSLGDEARLKAEVTKTPFVDPTEEEIKARYIKYAGLVLENASPEVKEAVAAKKKGKKAE